MTAKTFVVPLDQARAQDPLAPTRLEARVYLTYTCVLEHETAVAFWEAARVPAYWKCKTCSRYAALPGVALRDTGPYRSPALEDWEPKNHLDQLHERRTREELEALLQERLDHVRSTRKVT